MNVKVLRNDAGKVVGHYAASGDSITSQEARETVTAARGGQLLGVFDQGQVVGLIAVNPSTGEITGVTSLPGIDITDSVDRCVEHYTSQRRKRRMASGDYKATRQPRQRQRPAERPSPRQPATQERRPAERPAPSRPPQRRPSRVPSYALDTEDMDFDSMMDAAQAGPYGANQYDEPYDEQYGYDEQYDMPYENQYEDQYGEQYEEQYEEPYEGQYDGHPSPNMDGNWNQETRNNSNFIDTWGADENTGLIDPSSSGQIKWPEQTAPSPEPIGTMTTNTAMISVSGTQPTKKKPIAGIVFGILLLGLIVTSAVMYLTGAWKPIAQSIGLIHEEDEDDKDVEKSNDPIAIAIPDGYGSGQIGEILIEKGVIDDVSEFHKEITRQSAESRLKSGSYIFKQTMSMSEIVELLVEGPNDTSSRITVPEGLSVDKTAALVESTFGIPASEFKEQAKASNYVADYPFLEGVGDDSLDGFLFPKTYDFSGQTPDADMVIRKMLDQFKTEVDLATVDACKDEINAKYNLSLSQYDIIKVASIIEREATNNEDRPHIASVFYNRLRDGMALQSDATLGYVLDHEVTADDLQNNDSPYNSYKNKGLPPTPLCSSSLESIEAAKHPDDTGDYYFFIVEKDGYSNHSFSQTYEQHQEVIASAKREMKDLGLDTETVV